MFVFDPLLLIGVSGQLKSNNSQLMEEAAQALQNFAQQCSDPAAVEDVISHLFQILSGTDRLLDGRTDEAAQLLRHHPDHLHLTQGQRGSSPSSPRR